eukprot:TRINITY_DN101670_c0_g1_i1.p1 TRINITY_DN101670_c0_g1~~TRINITY_DN101670_c0_g1_i1.p1  ORF type:complete len:548 (-),score=90.01 TRINITY_DN101670_c0_g1_i1:101-1744(-)
MIAKRLAPSSQSGQLLLRRAERCISLVVVCRLLHWAYKTGPRSAFQLAFKAVLGKFLSIARKAVPGVNSIVEKELQKEVAKIEQKFHGAGDPDAVLALPDMGKAAGDVKELARRRKAADEEKAKQKFGKGWGGIYHDHANASKSKELCALQCDIHKEFSQTNALYPAVFTSVRKFEAEVVQMTLSILGGTAAALKKSQCGLLTSGGTESILIAVLTFREAAKERGIEDPEIIACNTAHPALDKACHYFQVRLVKVKPDPESQQLRASLVERDITRSTIAIFASAPTFPHGVVDAIEELSDLALKRNLLLHCDNCLGGYYLSFLSTYRRQWNFDLPGVSTISVDVHKYGFASKGVSVIAFCNEDLRRKAYFPVVDGPTLYVTPTLQGARGGAQIATGWATLMSMGQDGYQDSVRRLDSTFREFKAAIKDTDGICLLVDSDLAVIPVQAEQKSNINIYAVANQLEKKGWGLFTARNPACFSICIGEQHEHLIATWKADLQTAVAAVKANPNMEIVGDAAVYGAANALPDELLDSVVRSYVDTTLAVRPA